MAYFFLIGSQFFNFWFFCNIAFNIASRSAQVPGSDIIWRGDL